MARRRARAMTGTEGQRRRNLSNVATSPQVHSLTLANTRRPVTSHPLLTPYLDNRLWRPESPLSRPISRLGGSPARLKVHAPAAPVGKPVTFLPSGVAFRDSSRVLLCIRRARRKQVIHALGVAGRRVRKPKFRADSRITCRS